ncbi:hypothetical protein NADFUDRAFT_82637 [Nadsonia fulvescens var. elongata DSM 6958]|uniref:Uncharacterized protein n=1 Tax=Nadsonia fulvescens var. elongata DSM 6958 TaxID=857566 RepID=A0A1E3PJU7_9ASCO|nr:hypothetical protein NADFUDRAFT_82637 [Nadsonia fulvescens var. elongata DSM 6958]
MSRYLLPPSTVNDLIGYACNRFQGPNDFLVLIYIGEEQSFLSKINENNNDYELPVSSYYQSPSITTIPARALRSISVSSEPSLPTIFDKVFPIFLNSIYELKLLIASNQLNDYINERSRRLDLDCDVDVDGNNYIDIEKHPSEIHIALWGLIDFFETQSCLSVESLNDLLCQVTGKMINRVQANFTLADSVDLTKMIPLLPPSDNEAEVITKKISISRVLQRWLNLTDGVKQHNN